MFDINNSITSPLQNLNFIIEPFNKTTGLSVKKIVANLIAPLVECR